MDNDGGRPPHCRTCACDLSSPQAIERTKHVAPFKIPKDSMMFVLLTDPAALTRLLKWWRDNREHRNQPARLKGEWVAHTNQLEIVIHPPPPPPESYLRRRPRPE